MYILIGWIYAYQPGRQLPDRIGATMFRLIGYWIVNIPYFGGFLLMPYLSTVDSRA